MIDESAFLWPFPLQVAYASSCIPGTHVMKLRSERNTPPNLSHRSFPTAYLKSDPYPHVSTKPQRGWKRHPFPGWKRFHKIRSSLQHDLNVKRRMGHYSDAITSRFQSSIPEHIRMVLIDLHLPFYEPTPTSCDTLYTELTTSLVGCNLFRHNTNDSIAASYPHALDGPYPPKT
jgi:hypothetical protein